MCVRWWDSVSSVRASMLVAVTRVARVRAVRRIHERATILRRDEKRFNRIVVYKWRIEHERRYVVRLLIVRFPGREQVVGLRTSRRSPARGTCTVQPVESVNRIEGFVARVAVNVSCGARFTQIVDVVFHSRGLLIA